jgi:hypothetical protein
MRSLRFMGVVAAGAWLALASPGLAGDKSQSTMANPVVAPAGGIPALTGPIGTAWTNQVSKGKTKADNNCKIQVQLKGLTGIADTDGTPGTGDEVICVAPSHVTVAGLPLDAGAVLRGEVKSGAVKIKADLFKEGTGCVPNKKGNPLGNIAQFDGALTCYEKDPGYVPGCATFAAFTSDPTQGACALGFPVRPASNIIATQGISFIP